MQTTLNGANQTNLYTSTLAAETAAFHAACTARGLHDFYTAEYYAAQRVVDAHYAKMQTLQACVPWREWA